MLGGWWLLALEDWEVDWWGDDDWWVDWVDWWVDWVWVPWISWTVSWTVPWTAGVIWCSA